MTRVASMSFWACTSLIAARMPSAKSMFISWILEVARGFAPSAHAIGERGLDLFAGVKGAEHGDRLNGRQSERGRHVWGEAREPEHLDVKLFTSFFHGLQIRARVVP